MNPSILNTKTGKQNEMLNTITNFLTSPLGSMFSLRLDGKKESFIAAVEENTFEIFNAAKSAVVDGDTLINLFLGKQLLSTLKFQ